jgi:hypothetical protein
LKALVSEDAADKVWLSYNDPNWLAQRRGPGTAVAADVAAMAGALDVVVASATKPSQA